MIVWLTGLPCSGKTTIGKALETELERLRPVTFLDADVIRGQFWPELGFSKRDRDVNVIRLGSLAALIAKDARAVIVACVSPYRAARESVRKIFGDEFLEVYVNAPLSVCEARDVKGMYRKARAGQLPAFTGISDPYEPPLNPEVECNTEAESISKSVGKVLAIVESDYPKRLSGLRMAGGGI
jgi:adenylylsulfate kinase